MSQGGKVVIIGAGGRMGATLVRRYAPLHEVVALKRTDLDVLHLDLIRAKLGALDFDCVIYAAGITNVDECEIHPDEAATTNRDAPEEIARICSERGARLIHVSTDYVFGGDEEGARTEAHEAHPINVYGTTKLEGEQAVLSVSPDFLVIRVSWLFGPDKPSFPDMIIKRALESSKVDAVSDKLSCPTYSEDLAGWMEPMIADPRYRGVLHLSNAGICSWQEYGQSALDIVGSLGLPLKTRHVEGISRVGLPAFVAKRPANTALDTARFQEISGTVPRHWREALLEYLSLRYRN
jgi:dTDP-4-dehydrorhamnose reductase